VSNVFHRVLGRELPVAVRAEGSTIWDADGRRYLDAAGGAIVVGIGHGDPAIAEAMSAQAARAAYVHGTQFTTEALEAYAAEVAPLLPLDDARLYPVSGGSEAVETAFKMARAYHLATGQSGRHKVIARWGSYHGNTRGALDASGKRPLRRPYEPWLGQAVHVPAAYEYRCENTSHPDGCAAWHAERLEEGILAEGPETVACFIGEPIVGATLGAALPADGYWQAVADVCRRHGVLLIADEVMTGFGRAGTWFGSEQFGLRPDILVAAKGATSGYWPFGFAACAGPIHDAIVEGGFVHGFTYSHSAVGAAVARAVLHRLQEGDLIEASKVKGERLLKELQAALADHPNVGDVRGRGLMIGVELIADRDTKDPFHSQARVTERVLQAAREDGLLLYSSTGFATDDLRGDLVMFGPPFVITDEELDEAVSKTAKAIRATLPA
jgi:adenosylmethionine-8-amino-7-oxononanoate aminotransferase